jgi:hypothetical protein
VRNSFTPKTVNGISAVVEGYGDTASRGLGKRSESQLFFTKASSRVSLDFINSREQLRKHQNLNRYYQKQSKSRKDLAVTKEWSEYYLEEKKEAQSLKMEKMEEKRKTQELIDRERIEKRL